MKLIKFILDNWKKCVVFALIFSLIVGVFGIYTKYFTERKMFSYVYINAEKGRYPDGSRFEIYDILSDEVLEKTLERLNEDGKFLNRTVADLRSCFSIDVNLSGSVASKIKEARKSGQNYTYIPNDYIITASTAKRFGFSNILHFFSENSAEDLLNTLTEVYYDYFLDQHTEDGVILKLSSTLDYAQYDYPEIADALERKLNMYLRYLTAKKDSDASYRSSATNKTFDDLLTSFQNLVDIRVTTYKSYVYASKISKDKDALISEYQVQINELQRDCNKKNAEAEIASKAMKEYDHTFEESIVIPGVDAQGNVYQVKPKTGYDYVTKQSLEAGVSAGGLQAEIDEKKRLIDEYSKVNLTPDEAARIAAVSNQMIQEIEKEMAVIEQQTRDTVSDYLSQKNSDYIKIKDLGKSYVDKSTLIKILLAAIAGALVALLYAAFLLLKRRIQNRGEMADEEYEEENTENILEDTETEILDPEGNEVQADADPPESQDAAEAVWEEVGEKETSDNKDNLEDA